MPRQNNGQPQRAEDSAALKSARAILAGREVSIDEALSVCKCLRDERQYGHARRVLARVRHRSMEDPALRLQLAHLAALCTYQDPDLPADARLAEALGILERRCSLKNTRNQETLGLAGSIYKRRWQIDAQKENLERALSYYLRGYEQGPENDYGYTGINAAFVLDVLADVEEREATEAGTTSDIASTRREESLAIREDLAEVLPPLPEEKGNEWLNSSWWFLVTIGEALFGLERYDEAAVWLERAGQLNVEAWKYATTAKQLCAIARLRLGAETTAEDFAGSAAGRVLKLFLGQHAEAIHSAFTGKVGLALSGGGFRASLFHIGVLAQLAETDLLRHVEVLSCVSGGSILGAHYYLLLRELLQRKPDGEITREDYVDLIRRLEVDFLAGVRCNLRSRVAAEFYTNLRMIFLPRYSRTMRVGELYERYLYQRVGQSGRGPDEQSRARRWLTDLFVSPPGEKASFRPRDDNWRRRAKVPELVLNATTLNTGHNWQFTASWMGEPPGSINTSVDGNYRLRRMYYRQAPAPHDRIRLGQAVAASSCVPGLFEPLTLSGLYPGVSVALVDGGVHDNQGIVGLLEQDCQVLLISDASGQTSALDSPNRGMVGVPLRANSILMARVREEQFEHLEARRRSGLLRGLMILHLKRGLGVAARDWTRCDDPREGGDNPEDERSSQELTSYGVPCDIQRSLAGLRTDLDSFNDAEAWSLMTSGYRMTGHTIATDPSLQSMAHAAEKAVPWEFLAVEPLFQDPQRRRRLLRILNVGRFRSLKPWRLLPRLKWLAAGIALVAILLGALLVWRFGDVPLLTINSLAIIAGVTAVGALFGKIVARILDLRSTLSKAATGLALAIAGPVLVRLHVHVFDRYFLEAGRIDRIE